jgi:hypothetical protein
MTQAHIDEVSIKMKEAVKNETAKPLTLENAKLLKGKRIQTIYFGYKGQNGVDDFTVGEIVSEWDLAATKVDEKAYPQGNQQLYWASFMSKEQIAESKSKLVILKADGKQTFIYCHQNSREFEVPTFTCSDVDREVYFIEVDTRFDLVGYSKELVPFFNEAFLIPYPFMSQRIYNSDLDKTRKDSELILKILSETKCKNPFENEVESYVDENLEKLCSLMYKYQLCDRDEKGLILEDGKVKVNVGGEVKLLIPKF